MDFRLFSSEARIRWSILAVLAVSLLSPGVQATQGSPRFLEVDYLGSLPAGQMEAVSASAPDAVRTVAQSLVSRFSEIPNAQGDLLLPSGTICESVAIEGGVLKAYVTLPVNLPEDAINELTAETAAEILRLNLAFPAELKGTVIYARKGSKSEWKLLSDFAPRPSARIFENDGWYEPEGPGPVSTVDSSARGKKLDNVTGQGPLGLSTQPQGALSGRTVYFSAGHGWTATSTGWGLARPRMLQMNEDHGNLDAINFFAHYLFNAGATVVPMRPLAHQENEVVMDNTSAGVSWTGTWSNSSNTRYYGPGSPPYRYASVSATETATAVYTPNIPEAGVYPVYCWANTGTDRAPDQIYRILHSGGASEVRVNHRRVGCGWVWLGNYYFTAGSNPSTGSVVISNQSASTSTIVIADAIRFGNGEGDIDRGNGISGYLRETEQSRYWVERAMGNYVEATHGDLSEVYDWSSLTDGEDNVGTPPRMAAQMRSNDGQGYNGDIYLGFHTNAGGGRGVVGLITTSSTPANCTEYAQLVGIEVQEDSLIEDGAANWPRTWSDRGSSITYKSAYGEFSGSNLNWEMCGTIVEVAFHDDEDDAILMREPKVRNVTARACYQAIVRYFNTYDGGALAFLPEPPVNVRASNNGTGGAVIAWQAGPSGGAGGDAATGYVVYRSTDGLNFGNPVTTAGTSVTINGLTAGETYHFRVAATNAGGESFPSEVVSTRISTSSTSPILIVSAYDRIDRYNNRTEDRPVMTDVDRLRLELNNSYNYVAWAADAIAAYDEYFDSCANEAVTAGQVTLGSYTAVVWLVGEESSGDETLSTAEQTALQTYLNGGGRLFISGAEIGYDLVYLSGGATFFADYLKAGYYDDDAETYTAQGAATGIFSGLGTLTFDNGSSVYDVDWPDQLLANGGSTVNMTYVGGNGGNAGVEYSGTFRLVHLGFPWETILGSQRQAVMNAVLDYFIDTGVENWLTY